MRFDQLKWHQAVVELRFSPAFRLWDHAGDIAQAISDSDSAWLLDRFEPAKISFSMHRDGLQASVGLNQLFVIQRQALECPDLGKGEKFFEKYATVCSIACSRLGLKEYSRIGFRTILHYSAASDEESIKAWQSLPFVKLDVPKEVGTLKECPEVVVPMVSDEVPGVNVTFRAERVAFEVNLGPYHAMPVPKIEKVHKLSSEKRRAALAEMAARSRVTEFLPKFGVTIDLDWSQEDLPDPHQDQIEKFVEKCRAAMTATCKRMLGEIGK